MSNILILGGGTGGIVAANVLRKTVDKKHKVQLVDRKDSHIFYGTYGYRVRSSPIFNSTLLRKAKTFCNPVKTYQNSLLGQNCL